MMMLKSLTAVLVRLFIVAKAFKHYGNHFRIQLIKFNRRHHGRHSIASSYPKPSSERP